jgi:hypothetical protein
MNGLPLQKQYGIHTVALHTLMLSLQIHGTGPDIPQFSDSVSI